IARVEPAIFHLRLYGALSAVVAQKRASATDLQFAVRTQAPFQWWARLWMRLHPVSYGLQIKSVTLVACQQPGFGGAIDVAQRYTHGMEHAKHIWCHGGTTAAGTAQPGQAEQISQRAQNQCIGDR